MIAAFFRWLFERSDQPPTEPENPLKGTPLYNSYAELEDYDERSFFD